MVDEYFAFLGKDRQPGPWGVLLENAEVTLTKGTALVRAEDNSLAVIVAIDGARAPKLPGGVRAAQVITELGGQWLFRTTPGKQEKQRVTAVEHGDIETWPENMHPASLAQGAAGSGAG